MPAPIRALNQSLPGAERKVFRRLVPFLMVCYTVAYLDRVNLGFAKLQMCAQLGFDDAVYGLGAGIFFIGYILFQVPANLLLVRVGARRWLGWIMVAWGFVSALSAFTRSAPMFYGLRFLLGVAEAGFYPGVVFYLSSWFPARRFAQAMTLFMAAIPLSGIMGNPLSGWIMGRFNGAAGFSGWRWLFLIEAAPAVVVGLAALRVLNDRVEDAAWLDAEERTALRRDLTENDDAKPPPVSAWRTFASGQTWFLCLIGFLFTAGQYGLSFWMPTLVSAAHITGNFRIGIVSALPYIAGIGSMLWLGYSADRHRERRWHLVMPAVIGAGGLVAATLLAEQAVPAVLCLCVAAAGILVCTPLFWSLPTAILRGPGTAAGIGGINACGNFAGFCSPVLVGYLRETTHHNGYGMYVLAAMMVLGAIGVLRIPASLVNR